jgi:hypothetical protein
MIKLVIIVFGLTSLFSFFKYKTNKITQSFILLVILLILLAAFRDGDAVRDYSAYVWMYRNASVSLKEISFSIIAWLVKYVFNDNVIFLFLIYAILGVYLKTKVITELTALCFLSLVIYISNFYILHELTQIRVGVATGFLLICIKPIYERDLRKFILFASCAVIFHYSALPIYFLWFLKSERINKYFYAVIIPFSYIFYFLHIDLIKLFIQFIPIAYVQQKYATYVQLQKIAADATKVNIFNYVFLVKCLIFYIILWKSNLIKAQNRYITLLLKIEALSLASFILFSAMPVFSWRISELFGVVEIILIPLIYYVFKQKLFSTFIVTFIGLCILLINIFYAHLIIS